MNLSSHRRLNVLHVASSASGGVAEVTLSYVRDQVERGWHVTVACPTDGPLGYAARAAGARVRWWSTVPGTDEGGPPGPGGRVRRHGVVRGARGGRSGPGLAGMASLAELAALRTVVEAANPDLVHLHGARAGIVGRLVLRDRVATVVQPHGWSFVGAATGLRAASWRWERFAARWTTEMVCVSAGERATGEEHGVTPPTTVLPNGIDLDRFPAQGEGDRRRAREELGLDDAPTVVCVGRLALQKGQQDLLADWAAVRERVPDARLALVGDGPDRDALARQAARLSGVVMPGWRSDLERWYAAADVVVVPSRWEGMSLVPLEAMASSRSVVVTDVAGMAESVPAEAGAVVPAHDGQALVAALVQRLRYRGEAEDEGWNGRAHVEKHHDALHAAQELSRVYLRLVSSRR